MDLDPALHDLYRTDILYVDRFDAVVNKDHPIHQEMIDERITAESLLNKNLLLPGRKAYGHMVDFIEDFLPKGYQKENTDYYFDIDAAMLKVYTSNYVAFSSEHNIGYYNDLVDFVPLSDIDTSYSVSAFTLKSDADKPEIQKCLKVIGSVQKWLARW